ncbi:hypothetical protein ACP70R_038080 [Stipagrostis hirtigluma subsp. patula]
MGNLAPTRMAASTGGTGRCARVMLPGGLVRHMELPATAAELMLEEPGHFLADERAMRRGRRVEAVRADADLERGVLYAALPMRRLGSLAKLADMARLAASGEEIGGVGEEDHGQGKQRRAARLAGGLRRFREGGRAGAKDAETGRDGSGRCRGRGGN